MWADRVAPGAVLPGEGLAPRRRGVPGDEGQGGKQSRDEGAEESEAARAHQWLIRQQTGERSRRSRVKLPKTHSRRRECP